MKIVDNIYVRLRDGANVKKFNMQHKINDS